MPRVLDHGDDVRPPLGHVDEVAPRAVRELDRVDGPLGADDVGDVGDRGAGRGAEVEDLGAWRDVDGVDAGQDGGGELGAEGVPDAVLDLLVLVGGVGVGGLENGRFKALVF